MWQNLCQSSYALSNIFLTEGIDPPIKYSSLANPCLKQKWKGMFFTCGANTSHFCIFSTTFYISYSSWSFHSKSILKVAHDSRVKASGPHIYDSLIRLWKWHLILLPIVCYFHFFALNFSIQFQQLASLIFSTFLTDSPP